MTYPTVVRCADVRSFVSGRASPVARRAGRGEVATTDVLRILRTTCSWADDPQSAVLDLADIAPMLLTARRAPVSAFD